MAGLSPTTVTRSMHDSYENVSSVPTLCALAEAAGVPTVLDFLADDTDARAPLMAPPPRAMKIMLEKILPAAGCEADEIRIDEASSGIAFALALLSRDPANVDNEGAIHVAAEAAAARLTDGH